MSASRRERVCGFYGKIPAAGDFIGRGLPRELTRRWDRWMEMSLRQAIDTGGGGGVWRFRAAPCVFASVPVAGVFRLSRDRVGRRFPMLIAVAGGRPAPANPWYDDAEALLAAACAGGSLEALSEGVSGLVPPGVEAGGSGASFWRGEDGGEVLQFSSASALASGGLDRIFLAGGPPDLDAAGEGGDLDPLQLWQDAAGARDAPSLSDAEGIGETETLDFDDLLGAAGLGEGGDLLASPPDPLGSPALTEDDAPGADPDGDLGSSAESGDPLEDFLSGGLDTADPIPADQPVIPEHPPEPASTPTPTGETDPLADFLDAEAAPLSGELPVASIGEILHGGPASQGTASLPEDFLDSGPSTEWNAPPAGLSEDQDQGDPIDALWGDDLPPPADPGVVGQAPALPEVELDGGHLDAVESEERLDLDDLIDGLGGADDQSKP